MNKSDKSKRVWQASHGVMCGSPDEACSCRPPTPPAGTQWYELCGQPGRAYAAETPLEAARWFAIREALDGPFHLLCEATNERFSFSACDENEGVRPYGTDDAAAHLAAHLPPGAEFQICLPNGRPFCYAVELDAEQRPVATRLAP